ncbi:MAG: hypothetical protein GY937_01180 [bacterium]|nr:hypothetical protein [bacterium]
MQPTSVLIVVASETGRTLRMAESLADGAREISESVTLTSAAEARNEQLLAADAIVLGSGVHMAGMESSMRGFLERTAPLWMQGKLKGKLGAVFASAGAGGRGGGELTLISLLATLAEHGLLLVPMHNRLDQFAAAGCHWGPLAETSPSKTGSGPTETQLASARAHGRWIAECADRWSS